MDFFSTWHWLIVIGILLLVFGGRGTISQVMGDVAKGIKDFKKGMADTAEAADHTASVDEKCPTETQKRV